VLLRGRPRRCQSPVLGTGAFTNKKAERRSCSPSLAQRHCFSGLSPDLSTRRSSRMERDMLSLGLQSPLSTWRLGSSESSSPGAELPCVRLSSTNTTKRCWIDALSRPGFSIMMLRDMHRPPVNTRRSPYRNPPGIPPGWTAKRSVR